MVCHSLLLLSHYFNQNVDRVMCWGRRGEFWRRGKAPACAKGEKVREGGSLVGVIFKVVIPRLTSDPANEFFG